MTLNTTSGRDEIMVQLREPGPVSDRLISTLLGLNLKAWTRDFALAESLVPMEAIYTLSHNDDRSFYWCDISNGLHNVQGWGRTAACALAAAGVAYLMDAGHEERAQEHDKSSTSLH